MTTDTTKVQATAVTRPVSRREQMLAEDARWTRFAGTMLLVLGTINCIGGIAAVSGSKFFLGAAKYLVGDLNSLGWLILAAGVVQLVAGIGIWAGSFPAVWLGVASAGINAILQLLFLPAQPFWSLTIFAIDVAVMHALITHTDAV